MVDQNWKIRIIRNHLTCISKAMNASNTFKPFSICIIDSFAFLNCLINIFELQKPKSRIELTHFSIYTWRYNVCFTYVAKVFQLISANFCFEIRADDCTTLKCIKYLRRM